MARDLKICFDRVVPDEYNPARATTQHNLARALSSETGAGFETLELAIMRFKAWKVGDEVSCMFLDGSKTQRKKVEAKAHEWERYANIKFKFVTTGTAEIRISFKADPGSWSALGTDALIDKYFPRYQPTMNFGWLEDDSSDAEYTRVVIHEFGHALGAIHEHQSPKSKLKWNKSAVYELFEGPPNYWSKAEIDHNIFDRYSTTQTNASAYDADSIMLYAFPGRLFTDGVGTKQNNALSKTDKSFIAVLYPAS